MKTRKAGILSERIASGKAEPISDFEKQLATQIIRKYEKKYGEPQAKELLARSARQTARRQG
ncbi:hypothetical protein OK351_13590 [Glutamicibacter sp. MNS18]|uniref:hypothetical protein n=1 Tax=Glutamicibacter sp. MNS18 TaxID=2989817 RepID=UPI0022364803|nr:hypothetical protein [Glutamicibacter sp. MNS18]MCW4466526.1 hypothetical protein [Glutamicibacter sp. MNS18]